MRFRQILAASGICPPVIRWTRIGSERTWEELRRRIGRSCIEGAGEGLVGTSSLLAQRAARGGPRWTRALEALPSPPPIMTFPNRRAVREGGKARDAAGVFELWAGGGGARVGSSCRDDGL